MAAGINDTFRQVGVALGIAAWGAIFLGRGAAKVEELIAGTPAATGERPRQLIEAASSGKLDAALTSLPAAARGQVADVVGQGLIAGLNEILMLGGIFALAAALIALWLVRERAIERETGASTTPARVRGSLEGGGRRAILWIRHQTRSFRCVSSPRSPRPSAEISSGP